MVAQIYPIAAIENYVAYTNVPNTIELTASFDVFLAPHNASQGGVKGALDKLCINQLFPGIYQIFLQDVFQTVPYPYNVTQPVPINYPKVESRNSEKILHAQVSLSNWLAGPLNTTPTNHRAYVWWWMPNTFASEMAPADPSIKNSLIVSIFNTETGVVEDVDGMRAHIMVTVVDTFDNADFLPGTTNVQPYRGGV